MTAERICIDKGVARRGQSKGLFIRAEFYYEKYVNRFDENVKEFGLDSTHRVNVPGLNPTSSKYLFEKKLNL